MTDFVIHRGQLRAGAPERDSAPARLVEVLRSIDSQMFLKKLVQFRSEFGDFDFDNEINACKLYYLRGDKAKAVEVLEGVRKKMLNYGETLLSKRMQSNEDMGVLGRLPEDVMRLILN